MIGVKEKKELKNQARLKKPINPMLALKVT
jgi:hypothetical protein